MAYGGLYKYMDAVAELGRNPVSKTRFSLGMEMSRLTRDETAEPVPRDQTLRRERGQGNIHFPVQLTTSRIGNLTQLILTLVICEDHTYITYLDNDMKNMLPPYFKLPLASLQPPTVVRSISL